MCSITIHNYTARARAYTILAKWPESYGTSMEYNPKGGRKEARGLWAWRLDTLDPGTSTVLEFGISGLSKGDWNEADIFFRGNGEIIGATKMDEALLQEQRKTEALEAAVQEVRDNGGVSVRTDMEASQALSNIDNNESGGPNVVDLSPSADTDWFGMEGDEQ